MTKIKKQNESRNVLWLFARYFSLAQSKDLSHKTLEMGRVPPKAYIYGIFLLTNYKSNCTFCSLSQINLTSFYRFFVL